MASEQILYGKCFGIQIINRFNYFLKKTYTEEFHAVMTRIPHSKQPSYPPSLCPETPGTPNLSRFW